MFPFQALVVSGDSRPGWRQVPAPRPPPLVSRCRAPAQAPGSRPLLATPTMAPPPAPRVKVGPVVKAPPCLWSHVAPAQAPMVLSAALVETLDLAHQVPVAWGLTLPSTEDPQ